MAVFSSLVARQWIPDFAGESPDDTVLVVVDRTLTTNRSVSLLHIDDGPSILALSPEQAGALRLTDRARVARSDVSARLDSARLDRSGLAFNDPDHLFYLSRSARADLASETPTAETRRLTDRDAAAFSALAERAPEDDLDEAFVELDHWLAFGTYVDDALVCAASMYPWQGTRLADLGVITLPGFRGRGLGRTTVRALSAEAVARGYEPQYRCQVDNAASVALARSAGFSLFGTWEVIDTER